MINRLQGYYEIISYNTSAILMAIFVGWADVFYTVYLWSNMVIGYNQAVKVFWRSLCWHEDSFEGWTYYYYLL